MAFITYYYNSYSTSDWTNPGNMVDNILTNYASTASSGDRQVLNGSTAPGTDLGTITNVQVRAYGDGDGNDEITWRALYGGSTFSANSYDSTIPGSPGWTSYLGDLYDDAEAPNPWDWTDVQNFDVRVQKDNVGKGNTMFIAKVEVRVTYTPTPGGNAPTGVFYGPLVGPFGGPIG